MIGAGISRRSLQTSISAAGKYRYGPNDITPKVIPRFDRQVLYFKIYTNGQIHFQGESSKYPRYRRESQYASHRLFETTRRLSSARSRFGRFRRNEGQIWHRGDSGVKAASSVHESDGTRAESLPQFAVDKSERNGNARVF